MFSGAVCRIDTWSQYEEFVRSVVTRFDGRYQQHVFMYRHPIRLQSKTVPRLRRVYDVPVSYTLWGDLNRPLLLCLGGVANTAMRFAYLADELSKTHCVVCMDWVGRGLSGWLVEQHDYSQEAYVEQVFQLLQHLGRTPVNILGSSLGGSVAISYAAQYPDHVERLILNDIGPFIPVTRRRRRSQVLGRHYVFRAPHDLLRRVGASQKNDGPLSDSVRIYNTHHLTRWSDEEQGRIYRHDPRAMQAFSLEAQTSLKQWREWGDIDSPTLIIHGLESDVLLVSTLERMCKKENTVVMHVPDTGHTPVLADMNQIMCIASWLCQDERFMEGKAWTVLHDDRLGLVNREKN